MFCARAFCASTATTAQCCATASAPNALSNHAAIARLLASVSLVENVFEHITTNVRSASRPCSACCTPSGSMLETKRHCKLAFTTGFSASHTKRGPKSLPPMPTLTTCVNVLPVAPQIVPLRTPLANSVIFFRSAATAADTSEAAFERNATCKAGCCSVLFTIAPLNIASRRCSTPASRTTSRSALSISEEMFCFETSTSSDCAPTFACIVIVLARLASAANI